LFAARGIYSVQLPDIKLKKLPV